MGPFRLKGGAKGRVEGVDKWTGSEEGPRQLSINKAVRALTVNGRRWEAFSLSFRGVGEEGRLALFKAMTRRMGSRHQRAFKIDNLNSLARGTEVECKAQGGNYPGRRKTWHPGDPRAGEFVLSEDFNKREAPPGSRRAILEKERRLATGWWRSAGRSRCLW